MPAREDSAEAIAKRLQLLRRMEAGDNQVVFAHRLGIERSRWNNLERGYPLSKDVALRIVQTWPDITLDWLFLGRTEGLTRRRAAELEEVAAHEKAGRHKTTGR
jgi:hypothetical protein